MKDDLYIVARCLFVGAAEFTEFYASIADELVTTTRSGSIFYVCLSTNEDDPFISS